MATALPDTYDVFYTGGGGYAPGGISGPTASNPWSGGNAPGGINPATDDSEVVLFTGPVAVDYASPYTAPTPPPTLNPNPGPVGSSPPPPAPPGAVDNCSTCVEPGGPGGAPGAQPGITPVAVPMPVLKAEEAAPCEVCAWLRARPWWWWLLVVVVLVLLMRKG